MLNDPSAPILDANNNTTSDLQEDRPNGMTLREFLKSILPDEGVYYLVAIKDGKTGHTAFTDLTKMAAALARFDAMPGVSVYHACASYHEPFVIGVKDDGSEKRHYRIPKNQQAAKAFWIDVDCGLEKAGAGKGYATKKEAVKAVDAFRKACELPVPTIVDSGNGLHFYWPLTYAITPEAWTATAQMFKNVLAAADVLADPSRTADFASILRPVGTHNRKTPNAPREVHCIQVGAQIDPEAFAEYVANYGVILGVRRAQRRDTDALDDLGAVPSYAGGIFNDDLTAHDYRSIPTSLALVAEKCAQVRHVRDTGGTDYESWRLTVGLSNFCEDGDVIADWSAKYDGYDPQQLKLKRSSWNAGPTTCAGFKEKSPERCNGCPHSENVKTPLALGRTAREIPREIIEVNADYAVIELDHMIYSRRARRGVKRDDLALLYANRHINIGTQEKPKTTTLDKHWLSSPDRATYPFLDLEPHSKIVTSRGGLNTFAGYAVIPTPGDIKPFMDLFEWLIPAENREYVLAWLACAMQRLAEPFYVALVVWSRNQGTGKSLIFETVQSLINSVHCPVVGQEALSSNFNEWRRDALLIVFDEVSAVNDRQTADGIKAALTATSHRVNAKYEPAYVQKNRSKNIFLSNHPDAAFITDTDRRFYVVEANSTRPPKEMIDRFIEWRDAGGGAALLYYLQTLDIRLFDPKAPAPTTTARREMIEDNRSDVERWLISIITAINIFELLGRDICTAEELTARYNAQTGNKASSKTINSTLRKLGIRRLDKQAKMSSGVRPRCYSMSNDPRHIELTESELGAIMDKPFRS
jgi:hypothetical protein